MSGFGWSISDIVLAAEFISKVVEALKEPGGAADDYRQAVEFLSSLEQTLHNIASAGSVLPQNAATQEILLQTKRIIDLLKPLYNNLKKSEDSLGVSASKSKKDTAKRLKSKLKWTFRQSNKVKQLQDAISVPLATINTSVGVEILRLIGELRSELPATTRDALSAKINDTILHHLNPGLQPTSQDQNALSVVLDSSRGTHRAVETTLANNKVQAELQLLRQNFEASSTMLNEAADPAPARSEAVSQTVLDPRDRMLQSLCMMAFSIKELIIAFLELVWPFLILFFRRLHLMRHHFSRLTLGDSVIFEDALGRTRHLPFEYFQYWDVFHPYLIKTFENVPGAFYVTQGRFHILNARNGTIVDSSTWKTIIRPGSQISMAITTILLSNAPRSCPCCGGIKKSIDPNSFVTCSTCNAAYRLLESAIREHLQTRDGGYWNSKFSPKCLSEQKSDIKSRNSRQQSLLYQRSGSTDVIKASPKDYINDVNLNVFKKIDIIFINEPAKIADRVEEMMSLVLGLDACKGTIGSAERVALSEAITLVREEAQQEINLFDFKDEYRRFLYLSRELVQKFSNCIGKPEHSVRARAEIQNWADWISQRIVPSLRKDVLLGRVRDSGMVLLFQFPSSKRIALRLKRSTTISEMKEMIQSLEALRVHDQYLVCRGKKLDGDRIASDYALSTDDYIHVLQPIWGGRSRAKRKFKTRNLE